jgi:hypothetical protein
LNSIDTFTLHILKIQHLLMGVVWSLSRLHNAMLDMDRTLDWIASQHKRSDSASCVTAVVQAPLPATTTVAEAKAVRTGRHSNSNSSEATVSPPLKARKRRDSNDSVITVIHRPLFKPRKRKNSNTSIVTVIHAPVPIKTTPRPKPKSRDPPLTLLTLPPELRDHILSDYFRPTCTCAKAGWDWHAVKENTWAYLGPHQPFDPRFPRNRQRSCLTHCLDILLVCKSLYHDAKEVFIREHVRKAGFLRDNILSARRLRSLQCFVGVGRRPISTEMRVQIQVPRRGTKGRQKEKVELDIALLVLNAHLHSKIVGYILQEIVEETLFWQGFVGAEENMSHWWAFASGIQDGRRDVKIEGPLLHVEDWGGLGIMSVQALVDVLRKGMGLSE